MSDSHIPNSVPCVSGVNRRLGRNTLPAAKFPVTGASVLNARLACREQREAIRRFAAQKREKASKTKTQRAMEVQAGRSYKERIQQKCIGPFEEQGGFDILKKKKSPPSDDGAPSVMDSLRSIAGVASTAYTALASAPETLREVSERADQMSTAIATITDLAGQVKSMINTVYEALCKYVPVSIVGAMLIGLLYWISGSQKCPSLLWSALCSCVAFYLGESVWDLIKEHVLSANDEVKEQSGFGWCGPALIMAMFGKYFSDPRSKSSISGVMNLIGAVPRASAGLEAIFAWIVGAAQKAYDYVAHIFNLPRYKFAAKYAEEIEEIIEEVYKMEQEVLDAESPKITARFERLKQLQLEIVNLKRHYKQQQDVLLILERLQHKISALAAPLRAAIGVGSGYTQLPVSVVMDGNPGVGKTMIIQNLATTVAKLVGLAEDMTPAQASKLVFIKPFNSEYFEGYHGQPFMLFDDFMMKKATPADVTNGLTDLMTYYSSFTATVNMAACENKGMIPFDSKFLIMTSNLRNLHQCNTDQLLIEPEALKRRVDMHYEVGVRPQYQMGEKCTIGQPWRLDYSKFEEELEKCKGAETVLGSFPWHIWEVKPAYWGDNRKFGFTPGTGRPMLSLILEMVSRYKSRKDSHKCALESAAKILQCKPESDDEIRELKQKIDAAAAHGGGHEIAIKQCPIKSKSPEIEVFEDIEFKEQGFEFMRSWVPPKVDDIHQAFPELCSGRLLAAQRAQELAKSLQDFNVAENARDESFISVSSSFDTCTEHLKEKLKDSKEERKSLLIATKQALGRIARRVCDFWRDKTLIQKLLLASMVPALALVAQVALSVWSWLKKNLLGWTEKGEIVEQSNTPGWKAKPFKEQSADIKEGEHAFVYNNSFKLTLEEYGGGVVVLGQAIYLFQDYCIMPLHFQTKMIKAIESGSIGRDSVMKWHACRVGSCTMEVRVGDFLDFKRVECEDRDLLMVRTGRLNVAMKDIRKFVVHRADLIKTSGNSSRLDTARMADDFETLRPYGERVTFISTSFRYGTFPTLIGKTWHKELLSYGAVTMAGDCGAPVCLTTSAYTQCRVFCGLHVGLRGFSDARGTVFCTEIMNDMLARMDVVSPNPVKREATFAETVEQAGLEIPAGFDVEECMRMPFAGMSASDAEAEDFGSFQPIGLLTKPVSSPVQTVFMSTFVLHDNVFPELEYTDRPMRLAPFLVDEGVMEYPMVEALKPYAGNIRSIDTDLAFSAITEAMEPFSAATVDVLGRVWTVEEAFVGCNGAKGIPLGTSMGLPGCIDYKNKRDFLDGMTEWDFANPKLCQLVEEVKGLERMLKDGVRPFFLARGFLKDETRAKGKKARYIAGTNIHYYVLCRMYFGQIVSSQMRTYEKSGMCPGINPYKDWGWLYHFLRSKGVDAWDGDFTGFDTSQQPQLLNMCLKYINEWYYARSDDKEQCLLDSAVREILFMDLLNSKHAVGRGTMATHVVQWVRSLPSGHFLTTFINSMLSMSVVVAAYRKIVGKRDFWEHCRICSLGDDNCVGVDQETLPKFNQITCAKVLKQEFSMIYTAGRKGEKLTESVPWDKMSFLQRTFREKNGVIVGPIRLKSIFGCFLHVKKGSPSYMNEVAKQNVETALCELSLHDEATWRQYVGRLCEIARSLKYAPRHATSSSDDYFKVVSDLECPWA